MLAIDRRLSNVWRLEKFPHLVSEDTLSTPAAVLHCLIDEFVGLINELVDGLQWWFNLDFFVDGLINDD